MYIENTYFETGCSNWWTCFSLRGVDYWRICPCQSLWKQRHVYRSELGYWVYWHGPSEWWVKWNKESLKKRQLVQTGFGTYVLIYFATRNKRRCLKIWISPLQVSIVVVILFIENLNKRRLRERQLLLVLGIGLSNDIWLISDLADRLIDSNRLFLKLLVQLKTLKYFIIEE